MRLIGTLLWIAGAYLGLLAAFLGFITLYKIYTHTGGTWHLCIGFLLVVTATALSLYAAHVLSRD